MGHLLTNKLEFGLTWDFLRLLSFVRVKFWTGPFSVLEVSSIDLISVPWEISCFNANCVGLDEQPHYQCR